MKTSTEYAHLRTAVLVVLSGRPGTGKTTIAHEVSRRSRARYPHVDAAETALTRSGTAVGVAGYAVIHELAASNLAIGNTVVVDAVNPAPEARTSWREAAARAEARLVSEETVVPDKAEHWRRVEGRLADTPGHEMPTWDEVQRSRWSAWDEARDGPRLLLEATETTTAVTLVFESLRRSHDWVTRLAR